MHIIWRTKNKRNSLVDALRFHIQHCLCPCSCYPTCLLNDEGHWVALIEKSELERKREHVTLWGNKYITRITSALPECKL